MKVLAASCLLFSTAVLGAIQPIKFSYPSLFTVPRDEVTFRLWNQEHKDFFRPIYYGHLTDEPSLKPKQPFKFLIHGWTDNADKGWYEQIVQEYLKRGEYNVIGVDWRKPASALYPASAKYVADVGTYVGELLIDLHETFNVPLEDIHLIGHSLGAHVSGLAGQYVEDKKKMKIGRITGMDPAGPLFLLSREDQRLSSGDAMFVDIIHSDGGKLGMSKVLGHADFYPNRGSAPQPGCLMYEEFGIIDAASCSHTRSHKLFLESINTMGFEARECESMTQLNSGACDNNVKAIMGENIDTSVRGVFYLATNGNEPYHLG